MSAERMAAETNDKYTVLDWARDKPAKAALLGGMGILLGETVDMCAAIDGNLSDADLITPDYLSVETVDSDPLSEEVSFEVNGTEYTAAMPQ